MARPSNRDRLLAAAVELIVAEGLTALTYDRLAAAARVSKGGLLYHFPSKRELTAALIEHALDEFEAGVQTAAGDDRRPGAWTRAYVDASLTVSPGRPEVAFAVLLSAPEVGPELLRHCGTRFAAWQQRIVADGVPPGPAATIRYACDGWWTFHALGAAPPADAVTLRAHLDELVSAAVRGNR